MTHCGCYEKAFLPVIRLLEKACGEMWFKTPDYDEHQQRLHDIIVSMNTKFRCIDDCWKNLTLEDYESVP